VEIVCAPPAGQRHAAPPGSPKGVADPSPLTAPLPTADGCQVDEPIGPHYGGWGLPVGMPPTPCHPST